MHVKQQHKDGETASESASGPVGANIILNVKSTECVLWKRESWDR